MDLTEKTAFVEDLRERFATSPLVILTNFQGSRPLQMDSIRRRCEPIGVHFRVVKNTLAKRAIAGTDLEPLGAHFKGNVGVLFSGEDAQAAAKLFKELVKDNDKLGAKAGYFDGTVLDEKGVAGVADLPSRAELLVRLLQTINEGPRRILGVIQGPARDLAYLLGNKATELEKQT